MENDIKIFGDKNFSDLSQEIYENNKLKKTQIDLLIQEVHGYIQGIEDIAIVGPIIKELMDVGIKNDDNLVKLATLYQRIMSKQTIDESGVSLLSDEEKEQLMASLEDVAEDLQKKKDDIVDMSEIALFIFLCHLEFFLNVNLIMKLHVCIIYYIMNVSVIHYTFA